MKRSEYKTMRSLLYPADASGGHPESEFDTRTIEEMPDFPGWDPEEPEKVEPFDEVAAPRTRASISGEPRLEHIDAIRQLVRERDEWRAKFGVSEEEDEMLRAEVSRLKGEAQMAATGDGEWFEWIVGTSTNRVSLSGPPVVEYWSGEGAWLPVHLSGAWLTEFVTAIRRLVYRLNGARRENEGSHKEILEHQANERRLRGEVKMAEAKAKDALVEIEHWKTRAERAQKAYLDTQALYRSSQSVRAELAQEAERLEDELDLFEKRNLSLVQERERHLARLDEIKQLAPKPFSREEWRYEFAGRAMAAVTTINGTDTSANIARSSVTLADALLEALEAGAEGEVGEEGDRGSSEAPMGVCEASNLHLHGALWTTEAIGTHRPGNRYLDKPSPGEAPEAHDGDKFFKMNGCSCSACRD